MEPFPADVTGFDIAHAALRRAIHFGFNSIAIITLSSQWENLFRISVLIGTLRLPVSPS